MAAAEHAQELQVRLTNLDHIIEISEHQVVELRTEHQHTLDQLRQQLTSEHEVTLLAQRQEIESLLEQYRRHSADELAAMLQQIKPLAATVEELRQAITLEQRQREQQDQLIADLRRLLDAERRDREQQGLQLLALKEARDARPYTMSEQDLREELLEYLDTDLTPRALKDWLRSQHPDLEKMTPKQKARHQGDASFVLADRLLANPTIPEGATKNDYLLLLLPLVERKDDLRIFHNWWVQLSKD